MPSHSKIVTIHDVMVNWAQQRLTARELAAAAIAAFIGGSVGVSLTFVSADAAKDQARPVATRALAPDAEALAKIEERVPPMARRVARFRIEYPEIDEAYPLAAYGIYPREDRPLMRRAEIENDLCHSSGEDGDAFRACNRRDAMLSALVQRDWCAEGTDKRDTIEWVHCSEFFPGAPAVPFESSWSKREIARVPWEVAELEQPCGNSASPGHVPELRSCAEAGFKREDALLNAAYVQLMTKMGPLARSKMWVRQRLWLSNRERGSAECAGQVAPNEASHDVALIRCRTGMTVPRRRDLGLAIPLAHEMWDGHPDRDWRRELDLTRDDNSLEELQFEYRDWELRNTEKRAKRMIDSAPGAGSKAVAIMLYYQRPYDPNMTAENRIAFASAIARVTKGSEPIRTR